MDGQNMQSNSLNLSDYDDSEIDRGSQNGGYEKPNNYNFKKKNKVPLLTVLKRIGIGIIACIVLLAVAGYCTLYFAFDTNIFSFMGQIISVNRSVKKDELYNNQFSGQDKRSFDEKLEGEYLAESAYLFSDREIAAYISSEIDNVDVNVKDDVDLVEDCDLKLIQVDFFNTYSTENPEHLTNMNVVVQLDMSKLKENNFKSFPVKMIKKYIPDTLYISATVEIVASNDSYSLNYVEVKVNNLSKKKTEKLLKSFSHFAKIGDGEDLCKKICNSFVSFMIGDGDNTLFTSLKENGVLDYSFYSDYETDYLITYKHNKEDVATISYFDTKDSENNNIDSYTVLYNVIDLKEVKALGYNFLGWYDSSEDNANKIEKIVAWDLKDYTLYARWEIIEYTIEYYMKGGMVDGENPTTYTIESELELLVPYKAVEAEFKGWTFKYADTRELVSGYDDPDMGLKIKKGTYGNLLIYARFDDERLLSLYADGKYQTDVIVTIGEPVTLQYISSNFDSSKVGMSGYSVSEWYVDEDLKTKYDYTELVSGDMTLYGEWNYVINSLKFYPYIEKFKQGLNNGYMDIESYEELYAYFEYIVFYSIEDSMNLKIKYASRESTVSRDLDRVITDMGENSSIRMGFTYYKTITYNNLEIRIDFKTESNATLVMDPKKTEVKKQYSSATAFIYETNRSEDFDDFKINNVSKTIEVSTSLQLFYCLEQGYRPLCVAGSNAEKVYSEAKKVLREICDDNMSDAEKLSAMYQWLALNVNYDHKAANLSDFYDYEEIIKYRAWYAEGVFFDKLAVCEGYAKAFIIMSRLEGIPMIYVTGNHHAWNKVMVENKWYGIDATHADSGVANNEVLRYDEFLFSDAYKTLEGYSTSDYSEIRATENYKYFRNVKLSMDSEEFDLVIEDVSEMGIVIKYIKNQVEINNYKNYTLELEISSNLSFSLIVTILRRELVGAESVLSYVHNNNEYGNINYVFIIESA